MPRLRGNLLILLFFMANLPVHSQEKQVLIRVIQNESSILSDFQTNIILERKAFKFQIMLKGVEGVYVFASIRDSVYRFTETSEIRDFGYLNLLELRNEDVFNSNRELNISEAGWSYWFYKPEPAEHAFNRKIVKFDSSRIICTKAIKFLNNVAETRVLKLRDVNTPLYLFFVAVAEYDSNGRPVKELMRRKVRIDWVDEQ